MLLWYLEAAGWNSKLAQWSLTFMDEHVQKTAQAHEFPVFGCSNLACRLVFRPHSVPKHHPPPTVRDDFPHSGRQMPVNTSLSLRTGTEHTRHIYGSHNMRYASLDSMYVTVCAWTLFAVSTCVAQP